MNYIKVHILPINTEITQIGGIFMIETMKRITITGPLEDLDRVVLRYLHSHKIEYISAQTQLSNMEHANLIQEKNPYELPLYTARDLLSYLNTEQEEIHLCDIDEALHLVHNLSERVHHYTALIEKYTDSLNSLPEESALEDCFKREHLNQLITEQERNLLSLLYAKRLEILSAYRTLELYQSCFQLRQYAVCITHTGFAPLYQLQGYIPESSIGHLFHDLHVDRRVEVYLDDCKIPDPIIPSKLKNNYFIKGYKHLIIKHHLPPYPLPDLSFLILLCYLLTFGSFYGNIRIGILLMIAGAAFSLGRSKNYGHIVFLCGGTCLIFGIIFYCY